MLRTQIHQDYFQDLFDRAADFDVQIEAHRERALPLTRAL
jgi:hypothetical protein